MNFDLNKPSTRLLQKRDSSQGGSGGVLGTCIKQSDCPIPFCSERCGKGEICITSSQNCMTCPEAKCLLEGLAINNQTSPHTGATDGNRDKFQLPLICGMVLGGVFLTIVVLVGVWRYRNRNRIRERGGVFNHLKESKPRRKKLLPDAPPSSYRLASINTKVGWDEPGPLSPSSDDLGPMDPNYKYPADTDFYYPAGSEYYTDRFCIKIDSSPPPQRSLTASFLPTPNLMHSSQPPPPAKLKPSTWPSHIDS